MLGDQRELSGVTSSGSRFPFRKSQRGWRLKEQRCRGECFFLPTKLSTDLPSGRAVMLLPAEWSPLNSAEAPLGTGWQLPAEVPLSSLCLSTEVIRAARGVSRLRDYGDHDEMTCGEFNLKICPLPSTLDQLLPRSGQRESLGSTGRSHSLMWACPVHTCATRSFLSGNLDPNGIASQWPEMTLFQDV